MRYLVEDKCQQNYKPIYDPTLHETRSHPPMPPQRKSKPRSPYHAALGQAIELVIAEHAHMTHETVSGLTVKQVGDLVRGRGNPTYTTILKLCRGLQVPPGELLERAEQLLETRMGR
jgi:DNA-binding Xre family transcriptional regulator